MSIKTMESGAFKWICAIFLAVLLQSTATASFSFLDQTGVTALCAVTTNVNGSGIPVGQVEASLSSDLLTWEVNPVSAYQTAAGFTFTTFTGTTNGFPNNLGVESWHADDVGQYFYGTYDGIATNVARVDNSEADYYYSNNIASTSLPGTGDDIVNQSFTFGPLSVSDQEQVDSQYDNYSVRNQTLFVSAANNYGINGPDTSNSTNVCAPGTSYNCISVGAYDNGVVNNSLGPTIDNGRCKPDITAPAGETSFSTPFVAGAAAVLMQAGLRGDGGSDTNSAFDMRTIKALLLNGAVKPANWTNSTSSPLDARYGAGMLNVLNAYEQLAGGKHGYISSTMVSPSGGAHPPSGGQGTVPVLSGWDFNTNSSGDFSDAVSHYYFNVTNSRAGDTFVATATLVWNRQQNQSGINNLNLFLYNCANSNLVLCSTSLVDNVEHIYIPQLSQGRYDLQVWKAGGLPPVQIVSAAESYALAWQFVSPALAITSTGANTAITWPVYPAGFLVQTATNLISPGWNTNNLPVAVITNGQNYLLLNATNAAQFFRLSSPDF
jgi:hypothetical protein